MNRLDAAIALAWKFLEGDAFLWVVLAGIAVFFCVTVLRSFLDVSFLDKQTRLASKQVQQLSELNDVGQFIQVAEPSLFRNHIQSLYTRMLKSGRKDGKCR